MIQWYLIIFLFGGLGVAPRSQVIQFYGQTACYEAQEAVTKQNPNIKAVCVRRAIRK